MDDHFAIRQAPSNCSSLRRSWAGTGDPGGPPVTTNPRPVSVTPMLIVEFDFRRGDCDPGPLRCRHQGHQEALGRTPISRCRVQMPWRGRSSSLRPVEFCIRLTEFFGQKRSMSSTWIMLLDRLPRLTGGEYAPRPASRYSGAPAIATGTSVPVLGAGFAQVTVPRTLAPWARAWDSVTVSFSWSLGALRASFHVATLLATP